MKLSNEEAKKLAAEYAVDKYVKSGQLIGLGTGTTALHSIRYISQKVAKGIIRDIRCIATSEQSALEATRGGLALVGLDDVIGESIEIVIDGADEIDSDFQVIKGRGAALFREKMIESRAKTFVIIADSSKMVRRIGVGSVPVEVAHFGCRTTCSQLQKLPGVEEAKLRYTEAEGRELLRTDNGNVLIELYFRGGAIEGDLMEMNDAIIKTVGVLETGLFLNMHPKIVVASTADGSVKELNYEQSEVCF